MAKLYIVPTPVGNLEDMTFRAVRILKEADLILAEDTRTSSVLLKHYEIRNWVQSHHKFNEHRTVKEIVERVIAGENIALISDAGTPGISDPGFLLVRECIRQGAEVECLPGATAFVPALVVSGLPTDRFCFEGFLPPKKGRQTRLRALAAEERSIVLYESPYRILKTLTHELSKRFEETCRGTIEELISYFSVNEPKGEFVIIVSGAGASDKENEHNV